MTDDPGDAHSNLAVKPGIRGPEASGTIALVLEDLDDLFEARSPDPLRGRFDDRSGFEQLLDAVGVSEQPLRIEITLMQSPDPRFTDDDVGRALGGYATTRLARVAAGKARIRRLGLKELAFGLGFLAACLLGSSALAAFDVGADWFRGFIVEGLVIVGWIALWHPVDMLFFERLPLIREQRVLERIRSAQVRLHVRRSDLG